MGTPDPLAPALELCRTLDLIPEGGTVLCAVSGGADSVCLLHWLSALRDQIPFTLAAAHYNHNLRGEQSARDEAFVRTFAEQFCPVITGTGDVAAEAAARRAGIEETARDMRYTFLQQAARQVGADVIATAHNANDNAETMLLNLMRGCGLNGLCGIPPHRDNIVRPLLTTPRQNIEEYLRVHDLPHVEDCTNSDDRFTRNRVRHQLIPLLEQFQPRLIPHLTQTARLLTQDELLLSRQAQEAICSAHPIPEGVAVEAHAIAGLPDPLAARAVRLLLDRLNGDGGRCTMAHLLAVVDLCRSDSPSAQADLPDGILARRVYETLELVRPTASAPMQAVPLPLPGLLSLPHGTIQVQSTIYDGSPHTPNCFYLSCEKTCAGLTLRSRRTGDVLSRPGHHARTLKKLMIDEKLPRHMRDTVPVLDCAGLVAGVIGLGPDAAFLPQPGKSCWHITYISSDTERKSSP